MYMTAFGTMVNCCATGYTAAASLCADIVAILDTAVLAVSFLLLSLLTLLLGYSTDTVKMRGKS